MTARLPHHRRFAGLHGRHVTRIYYLDFRAHDIPGIFTRRKNSNSLQKIDMIKGFIFIHASNNDSRPPMAMLKNPVFAPSI